MKQYTVLCNIVSHGSAYGVKGGTITLPAAVGDPLTKGDKPKLKLVPEKAAK